MDKQEAKKAVDALLASDTDINKLIDSFMEVENKARVTWKGGKSEPMSLVEAWGICSLLAIKGVKSQVVLDYETR